MNNSTTILISPNNNIICQNVNDCCCVYLKDIKKAAVLNITASCIFHFLQNKIQNDCTAITFGDIIEEVKSKFTIPRENEENLKKDIEEVITKFKEIGLFVS